MITDPIADLLTRIRNAIKAEHRFVDVRYSKIKLNIIDILKQKGFVDNYLVKKDPNEQGKIRVFLKYAPNREPVIQGLRRVSKPGIRRYVESTKIPYVMGGIGISILSTSQGIIVGDEARRLNLGGEVLCCVW